MDYQDKWIPAKYVPMWLKREKFVEDVLRRLPDAVSTDWLGGGKLQDLGRDGQFGKGSPTGGQGGTSITL